MGGECAAFNDIDYLANARMDILIIHRLVNGAYSSIERTTWVDMHTQTRIKRDVIHGLFLA